MKSDSKALLARFQSLLALVLMVVALSLASDQFLTVPNLRNILLQISINLCLSIGMTLIILSGGIDLSVGSVLALAGTVAAGLLKNGLTLPRLGVVIQFTVFGAIIGGIAGAAAGTAVAVQTADRDVVVTPGAAIVMHLSADVTVLK